MNEEIRKRLEAPFSEKDIEWRAQRIVKVGNSHKAIMLAYLTSRAVMQRLDDVFGVFGWQDEYERWGENGVKCTIWIRDPATNEWVKKTDGADDTDIEATKGGFSNSLKRACVKLGIGRYLYNLDEAWCDILSSKPDGEYIYINDRSKGIQGYAVKPTLPAWALPSTGGHARVASVNASGGSPVVQTVEVQPEPVKAESVKKAFDAQITAIKKMANMLETRGFQVDGEPVTLDYLIGGRDINDLTFDEAVEAIKRGNDLISGALN